MKYTIEIDHVLIIDYGDPSPTTALLINKQTGAAWDIEGECKLSEKIYTTNDIDEALACHAEAHVDDSDSGVILHLNCFDDLYMIDDDFIKQIMSIMGLPIIDLPIDYREIKEQEKAERNKIIFANYKQFGGKHSYEEFAEYLEVFFAITLNAYIGGPSYMGGKDICYGKWVRVVDSRSEANKYFKAVDQFNAYT